MLVNSPGFSSHQTLFALLLLCLVWQSHQHVAAAHVGEPVAHLHFAGQKHGRSQAKLHLPLLAGLLVCSASNLPIVFGAPFSIHEFLVAFLLIRELLRGSFSGSSIIPFLRPAKSIGAARFLEFQCQTIIEHVVAIRAFDALPVVALPVAWAVGAIHRQYALC